MNAKGDASAPLRNPAEAATLAQKLLDPDRSWPVLVVAVPADNPTPGVDLGQVRAEFGDQLEVVVIQTGVATLALANALPRGTDVYGHAARVYPVGPGWTSERKAGPLRFIEASWMNRPATLEHVTQQLIQDCHAALTQAVSSTTSPAKRAAAAVPSGPRTITGTVVRTVAGRGWVQIDHAADVVGLAGLVGEHGQLDPEDLFDDVAPERIWTTGMLVRGTIDPVNRRVDIGQMATDPAAAYADVGPGSTIWVRAVIVRAQSMQVEAWPGRPVWLKGAALGPAVDARSVYQVGDVLAARVTGIAQGVPSDLSLEVDDSEPLDPPALIQGGPGWLAPPTPDQLRVRALATRPAEPEPPPSTPPAEITGTSADNDGALAEQIDDQQLFLVGLENDLHDLRAEFRRFQVVVNERLNDLLPDDDREDAVLFADPLEQLEFDVNLSWARRTTPGEKPHLQLSPWLVGPDFLASLDKLQGIDRSKVVQVMVDILTGRVFTQAARQVHQLRGGPGGDDPPVVRSDGAVCWRVALQHKSPSARRLHYWQRPDHHIEFSSVRVHDDFRP